MAEVASRELRNRTRALLDRVAAGERITITVDGRAVALLTAPERPRWLGRAAFIEQVLTRQADPALAAELRLLAEGSTDELDL